MLTDFLATMNRHLDLIVQILLALGAAGGLSFLVHRTFETLKNTRKVHWVFRTLSDSIQKPSQWFIWGLTALFILQLLLGRFDQLQGKVDLWKARQLYFAIGAFWLSLIWKERIAKHFLNRAERRGSERDDKALIQALNRLATIFLVLIGVVVVLDIFEVPLAAFVASGAVGGLAISLAAKDMISNFFGGLMIYIHRHFVVGDWILSPNKSFEGVVEDIGWYMTRIRTFDRRPMFIPNSVVTDAIIENPGRMYNRRIKKEIGIRYQDMKVAAAVVQQIKEMLQAHPAIDTNQTLMVDLVDFGPYAVLISIYCFTKTTNWQKWRQQQQDILLKIAGIIDRNGAEIAFPTNTLHIAQTPHGEPVLN